MMNERTRHVLREAWFRLIQFPERHLVARYSPHGNATFFDPQGFAWTERLEANWKAIRREMGRVLERKAQWPNFHDLSENITITDDERWKTYFLYSYGHKLKENCRRCPKTTRLIEGVPGMKTAFFSVLEPRKHIPLHRGPYKGVLRYHLGLKVPEPSKQSRIRVGPDERHWEEGRSLMFDDTHEHEVWNDTDGTRVVLFMDVVRPLPSPLAVLNRSFLKLMKWSPPVLNALKAQRRWEKQLPQLP